MPNVARFPEQAEGLVELLSTAPPTEDQQQDLDFLLTLGELFTLVVYGQLILEQAALTDVDSDTIDQIFDVLVRDFSAYAVELHGKASSTRRAGGLGARARAQAGRGRGALRARANPRGAGHKKRAGGYWLGGRRRPRGSTR